MLDWSTIFSNMTSMIPWWLVPVIILIAFFKIKIEKWGKNQKKYKSNKNNFNNYKINTINNEQTYQNATDIATHFNISAVELNNIFQLLKWAYKENKWWIATKLGESK